MLGYNQSISTFEPYGYTPSTIYAVFYLLYIPIGHFLGCMLVFGWPDNYVVNLMSNAPVGLSAMVIGTLLTGFLSGIEFDSKVQSWVDQFNGTLEEKEVEESEFYASLVVMVVTGVWSYVACMYVNSPSESAKISHEKDPGKEL